MGGPSAPPPAEAAAEAEAVSSLDSEVTPAAAARPLVFGVEPELVAIVLVYFSQARARPAAASVSPPQAAS